MSPYSLGNTAFCPTRVKTLTTFRAADPWNGNRQSFFSVEAYVGAASGAIPSGDTIPPFGIYHIGLRSSLDGAERMLPESLSELWRLQRVKPEALPRLLKQLENDLTRHDYDIVLGNSVLRDASRLVRGAAAFLILFFLVKGVVDGYSPGEVIVMSAAIAVVGWLFPNYLYYWPKERRLRHMEWAEARG